MAVTTRAADPVLSLAVVTMVNDSTQLTRSTTGDRTEHFAVTGGNRVAKRLKVCRYVLPQAVCDRGHRLPLPTALAVALRAAAAGWPLKDLLDHRAGIDFGDIGQMQVDHRRLQRAMTEILLDDFQAYVGRSGIGVPERMRTDLLAKVDLVSDQLHSVLRRGRSHGCFGLGHPLVVPAVGGKQESFVPMREPVGS